jgi:nitrogen fixation protein FixH
VSPGTRWILIVVGLLVGNAVAAFALIGYAGGDTARRVVPHYYERAVAYDETMAAEAASAKLGWTTDVQVRGREVELTVRDHAGAPVAGATAVVRALPRAHADEQAEVTLVAVGPGVYRAAVPGVRPGLHELALSVALGDQRWVGDQVVDLAGGAAR